MTFSRRVRLFMLGIGLGTILSFLFFGKGCTNMGWGPEARVKLRLRTTLINARAGAEEQLHAYGYNDLRSLREGIDAFDVDFTDTRRSPDTMFYVLRKEDGVKDFAIVVVALRDFRRDSTATLWEVRTK